MAKPLTISIIGDGAMATVCGQILADKNAAAASRSPAVIRIWGRDAARLAEMSRTHINARYLPGIPLHEAVCFEADDAALFAQCDLIVCAIPTQFIRPTLSRLSPHIPPRVPIVSVAKGIEISTLFRPTQIIREILDHGAATRPVAAFSGPSIAAELARRLPATMVVAADEPADSTNLAQRLQELFTTPYLRVYRNDDLMGVELAGALKNVVAIAAGILDGMRAGNNAKAALLSRGLVEISRLGVAMGAQAETFTGLAGLGDLVTTCVSPEGRNRTFGERIGRGETTDLVLQTMVGVVEGMPTCRSVVQLARDLKIDMPISEGLYRVLFEGRDVRSQLADLMTRELKSESQ